MVRKSGNSGSALEVCCQLPACGALAPARPACMAAGSGSHDTDTPGWNDQPCRRLYSQASPSVQLRSNIIGQKSSADLVAWQGV